MHSERATNHQNIVSNDFALAWRIFCLGITHHGSVSISNIRTRLFCFRNVCGPYNVRHVYCDILERAVSLPIVCSSHGFLGQT